MHYHKVASEHPSNETAVAKFFMDFSKVTSVLVFSVVPENGFRSWHLSSLCCDILLQVAGFILTIPTHSSGVSLGHEAS